MFEVTKGNIAMGNSNPELFKFANYITKDVTNNGVYHYLLEVFTK